MVSQSRLSQVPHRLSDPTQARPDPYAWHLLCGRGILLWTSDQGCEGIAQDTPGWVDVSCGVARGYMQSARL